MYVYVIDEYRIDEYRIDEYRIISLEVVMANDWVNDDCSVHNTFGNVM